MGKLRDILYEVALSEETHIAAMSKFLSNPEVICGCCTISARAAQRKNNVIAAPLNEIEFNIKHDYVENLNLFSLTGWKYSNYPNEFHVKVNIFHLSLFYEHLLYFSVLTFI